MFVGAIGEDLYLDLSILHECLVCYCNKTSQPKQLRKQKGLLWVRVTMVQSPPWQGNVAAGMSDQPGRQDTQESHAIHAQEAEREIRK